MSRMIFILFLAMTSFLGNVNCKEETSKDLEYFMLKTKLEDVEVRKEPNLESEVIATIPKGVKVIDKKTRSDEAIEATIDGKKIKTHFHKIMLKDESLGWVFEEAMEVVRSLPEVNSDKE